MGRVQDLKEGLDAAVEAGLIVEEAVPEKWVPTEEMLAAKEQDASRSLLELIDASSPGAWFMGNGVIVDEQGQVLFSVINANVDDVAVLLRLRDGLDQYRKTGDAKALAALVAEIK